jgi:hypothetical protein
MIPRRFKVSLFQLAQDQVRVAKYFDLIASLPLRVDEVTVKLQETDRLTEREGKGWRGRG